MDANDSRVMAQLGALLGPIPAAAVGGITAPDDKILTGLASGGGSLAGSLGGGVAGALAGAGLGYGGGAFAGKLLNLSPSEREALRTYGAAVGSGWGGALGGLGGSVWGAGKGHDLLHKEGSDMSYQSQLNHAFAVGALEKMAELNVNPRKFVDLAVQTRDPDMCKIASAIVDFDSAVQREKTAASLRGSVSGIQDAASAAYGRIGDFLRRSPVEEAPAVRVVAGNRPTPLAGGMGTIEVPPGGFQMPTEFHPPALVNRGPSDLFDPRAATRSTGAGVDGGMSPAMMAALGVGGAGLIGGGAGLAYGMGDADTWQNKLKNMSNDYLGTDFETQSRLSALLENLRG